MQRLELEAREAQRLRSLGALAGGIAHDFNNLLQIVVANAEFVTETLPPDSPSAKSLRDIGAAVSSAARLCSDMLDYAGLEPLSLERLDLNAVVAETNALLEADTSITAKLEFSAGRDLPAIKADRPKLRHVIRNLVKNASEASHDADATVSIFTSAANVGNQIVPDVAGERTIQVGRYVLLEAADSGIGIPEKARPRLFEPWPWSITSSSTSWCLAPRKSPVTCRRV